MSRQEARREIEWLVDESEGRLVAGTLYSVGPDGVVDLLPCALPADGSFVSRVGDHGDFFGTLPEGAEAVLVVMSHGRLFVARFDASAPGEGYLLREPQGDREAAAVEAVRGHEEVRASTTMNLLR